MDKFGYYIVDNKKFYSKIQACIYATEHKLPVTSIKWYFNKNVYDAIDWQLEPEESLDELYDQRAREIRAQYDYIIISFSGGADSYNILTSFIRQGLHVDELIIHMFEKGVGGFSHLDKSDTSAYNNMHTDYVFHTLPMLKEISKKIPKTKITIVDKSDDMESFFTESKDESWIIDKTESVAIANVVKFNYVKDIRKTIEKSKSIGIILGYDKPRVTINSENRLNFILTDKGINAGKSVNDSFSLFDNIGVELFYWGSTSTSVKILIKQCHVIAKWLSAFPKYQVFFMQKNFSRTLFRVVHERILRNVIYTNWNINWFQADKGLSEWNTEINQWFFKDKKVTDGKAIWKEGLNYIEKHASPFVNKDITGKGDGLIVISEIKSTALVKVSPISQIDFGHNWNTNSSLLKSIMNNQQYLK